MNVNKSISQKFINLKDHIIQLKVNRSSTYAMYDQLVLNSVIDIVCKNNKNIHIEF